MAVNLPSGAASSQIDLDQGAPPVHPGKATRLETGYGRRLVGSHRERERRPLR